MGRERPPTRLDMHRAKRTQMGLMGPLLRIDELSSVEQQIISDEVFKKIRRRKLEEDHFSIYLEVLNEWGIICPHPIEKRLYVGRYRSKMPTASYSWFKCEACSCLTVNELWIAENPESMKELSRFYEGE